MATTIQLYAPTETYIEVGNDEFYSLFKTPQHNI